MNKTVLLSSAYFAPVQYYSKLNNYEDVLIERYDNYLKQTYRNRCLISTTNGVQALTVPIERYEGNKCNMKDIRISDHGNWRHLHWNALKSAYGESPYFEFYADDIFPFFDKRWDYLLDFNNAILNKVCELIDIHPSVKMTEKFEDGSDADDFRDVIRPKHQIEDSTFAVKEYYQVYKEKYGFIPNLSILDLLFNMGPESIFIL